MSETLSIKFRAHLAAELGERAADLITVAPGSQGDRTDKGVTSHHDDAKSRKGSKEDRLRAPEIVQQLYREDRIDQSRWSCR